MCVGVFIVGNHTTHVRFLMHCRDSSHIAEV